MIALLDANALIDLTAADHLHHESAESWLEQGAGGLATCPITQGALVRFVIRNGGTAAEAIRILRDLRDRDGHEFWADSLGCEEVDLRGVVGHRQVTDAYLASLARSRGGRLATFDRGLAVLHPDVVEPLRA